MDKYKITGMSCAACSARVERAVKSLDGVRTCSVNLLTATLTVDGVEESAVIAAVEAAGYGAAPFADDGENFKKTIDGERKKLINRLVSSLLLLVLLMYVSMGHVMWNFPLPTFLANSALTISLIQLVLSAEVMIINRSFFINGFKGVLKGAPNMDTLVALGSLASFGWSAYLTVRMIFDSAHAHGYLHELYFESAAMILGFITLGKLLESVAKGKTTNAIKGLLELAPKTAHVVRDGKEITVPSKEVAIGDIFIVYPGESFSVDGTVLNGESLTDESSLTGESLPVEKTLGSSVFQGTLNVSGYLECRATRVGEDTVLGEVVKTVSDAASSKAPIAKLADRVASFFVPLVLGLAFLTTLVWFFVNNSLGHALSRGISVLVISCPCALGLATPVAIMVASGVGARSGVLFKSAVAIETMGRVKTLAFDKTGTLTKGELHVTELLADTMTEPELLSLFASLESKSSHPIARAIVKCAEQRGVELYEASDFKTLVGHGVEATVFGKKLIAGSYKFTENIAEISGFFKNEYKRLSGEGKTAVFLVEGDVVLGLAACEDELREESISVVEKLRKMGVRTVILSGDNESCVKALADKLGVTEYYAEMLPTGKADVIKRLMADGKLAMVGDGINDAPALATADVGIAVGRGTDIAIESADVVLMNDSLETVFGAVRLARRALTTIKENLFWAFFYNLLGIPLAAGVFTAALGWELNPMFAALAMSLSSFTVVMNALRLNIKGNFKKTCSCKKEENTVLTLKIRGMMCPHCEARVKSVLEAFDGVKAEVSHKKGTAKLNLPDGISEESLVKAVIDAGYKCEIKK